MKRRLLKLNSIIVLFVLFQSCEPMIKTLGPLGSDSIEESKNKKVFICEYNHVNDIVIDSICIQIDQVFAERLHFYKSYRNTNLNISKKECQIVIVLRSNINDLKYYTQWKFKNFSSGGYKVIYSDIIPIDSLLNYSELEIMRVDTTDFSEKPLENGKGIILLHRKSAIKNGRGNVSDLTLTE